MSVVGHTKPRVKAPCSSDCSTCDHKANPDGGWCYMFRDEPEGRCLSHTGLKPPFKVLDGLIRSANEYSRQQRTLIDEMAAHTTRQLEDNPRHCKDTLYPLLCKEYPDATDWAIFKAIERAI